MKVLFTTCFLSPYRTDFFNELGKLCEVTVLAEENNEQQTHRNKNWFSNDIKNFRLINLNLPRKGKRAKGTFIWKYVEKYDVDIIVIGGYSTNTEIINLLSSRFQEKKIVLNFDGVSVEKIYTRGMKDFFKRILIKSADYYLSTGNQTNKFLKKYNVKDNLIYFYPFTSLYKRDLLQKDLSKQEKQNLKELLDIKEEKVIISVGRFLESKGFDVLLKAAQKLQGDIGIYIIGDKPTEDYLKLSSKVLGVKVYFIEFQTKDTLKKFYQASDIFVLPTRSDIWGLVVNEAMSNGLPVITTDRCVAGLELIENDINGYIVPVDNIETLREKLEILLNDSEKRMKMSKNNLKKIQLYTIENMAKRNFEILERIKKGEKND